MSNFFSNNFGSLMGIPMQVAGMIMQGKYADRQFKHDVTTSLRNYELQREQFDYMKHVQTEAWNREDNAVQRRVADLKAAGINPLLAAGGAAESSAPVKVDAPQVDRVDMSHKMELARMMMQSAEMNIRARLADSQVRRDRAEDRVADAEEENIRQSTRNLKSEERLSDQQYLLREALEARNVDLHELEMKRRNIQNALDAVDLSYKERTLEQRIQHVGAELRHRNLSNVAIELDNELRRIGIKMDEEQLDNLRFDLGIKRMTGIQGANQELALKALAIDMAREQLGMEKYSNAIYEYLGLPRGASIKAYDRLAQGIAGFNVSRIPGSTEIRRRR